MRDASRPALALVAAVTIACGACTAVLGIDKDYRPAADAAIGVIDGGGSDAKVDAGVNDGAGAADATDAAVTSVFPADAGAVVSVTAGRFHSCALFAGGVAKCWGRNDDYGELGNGSNVSSALPVPAMGSGGLALTALFAGAHDTCAVVDGGGICAGRGGQGELANGGTEDSNVPVPMSELPAPPIDIAAGEGFTCAVTASGDVYCTGAGASGTLGDGAFTDSPTPMRAQLGAKALAVAAFSEHACALLADGTVSCWGDNSTGELGVDATPDAGIAVPAVVVGVTGATAVGVGEGFTCALVAGASGEGDVLCWGDNGVGQLGDGTTDARSTPARVNGVTGAGALAVGGMHACAAIRTSGGVKCWGKGGSGELGNGSGTDAHTPVDVSGIDGYPISLASGGFHTCALLASPVVECWGSNDFGQLGDGTVTTREAPVAVQW